MRLGANMDLRPATPEQWLQMLKELGAATAVCPIDAGAGGEERRAYRKAAEGAGVVIAEVGVWNNTLDPDDAARRHAVDFTIRQLELAEELGARCCVNVAGARGPLWDGYYPANLAADTWALMVDTVREIIDAVNPRRTFYTLEPVGWMPPGTPDAYLQAIRDIDRPAFAVHLDYANMITGLDQYLNRQAVIRECFRLLGPHIKSVHAKDLMLQKSTPIHIDEVLPGEGEVDFAEVLRLCDALPEDMPVLVEHLSTFEECKQGIAHLRAVAKLGGIPVRGGGL